MPRAPAHNTKVVKEAISALRAATDRQGPTLIEIDQTQWMKAVSK